MLQQHNRYGFISDLYSEYNVKTEKELLNKLVVDSLTIPCIHCKKEYPIEQLKFPNGDPVCIYCG